jgi:hypothetical protein
MKLKKKINLTKGSKTKNIALKRVRIKFEKINEKKTYNFGLRGKINFFLHNSKEKEQTKE